MEWCFSFFDIFSPSRAIQDFYYANKISDDVTSGSSIVPKRKINNISANNKAGC